MSDVQTCDINQNACKSTDNINEKFSESEKMFHFSTVKSSKKVGVIIPVYNESNNLKFLLKELNDIFVGSQYTPLIIFVDDGSTDNTLSVLRYLHQNNNIGFVSFSRNFGKDQAIIQGIKSILKLNPDAIAYMDGDGQHKPNDLLKLINVFFAGDADIICGIRSDRLYQNKFMRFFSVSFYKIFNLCSNIKLDNTVGDFNVISPLVGSIISRVKEPKPFLKGILSWIGFKKETVFITVRERKSGESKFTFFKSIAYAKESLMTFADCITKIWCYLGIVFVIIGFSSIIWDFFHNIIIEYLFIFMGIQLIVLSILGDYINKIYQLTLNRPQSIKKIEYFPE